MEIGGTSEEPGWLIIAGDRDDGDIVDEFPSLDVSMDTEGVEDTANRC